MRRKPKLSNTLTLSFLPSRRLNLAQLILFYRGMVALIWAYSFSTSLPPDPFKDKEVEEYAYYSRDKQGLSNRLVFSRMQ